MFTKLRGFALDQFDEVTAGFAADDWQQLDGEHLDLIFSEIYRGMQVLQVDPEEDAVELFCRLMRGAEDYWRRNPHPVYAAEPATPVAVELSLEGTG